MVKCLLLLALALLLSPSPAMGQGRMLSGPRIWDFHATDVVDAADGDDPFDFDFFLVFDQSLETASIQREYHCSNKALIRGSVDGSWQFQADPSSDPNCSATEGRVVAAREMDHERLRRRLNVVSRFGLFRDLEFHAFLPVVLYDQTTLKMASTSDRQGSLPLKGYCDGPQCSQSTVYREKNLADPGATPIISADQDHSFFMLPEAGNQGPTRSALDLPTLGIWWAPYNHERDDVVATWRLGVDYRLNVIERAKASQSGALEGGIGQGYDELRFSMAMSRRFQQMHPFLEVGYSISNLVEGRTTPFHNYGDGQTLIEPGDRAALRFGSEVIPWVDPENERSFGLDFGGAFVYQFEGRDYTPLFDALGSSTCNDTPSCELTMLTGLDPVTGQPMRSTGITDVEQFGTVLGWLGFKVKAHRYAWLQARATLAHQMAHFLTFADAGIDTGVQDSVSQGQLATQNAGIIDPDTPEENPVFSQHMDLAGSRFRITNHVDFGFFVSGALTF